MAAVVDMDRIPNNHFARAYAFTKTIYNDVYPSIDPYNPALSQAGKVIVITGASSGIGAQGIAPSFAKAGAKAIVLAARREESLQQVASTIQAINPNIEVVVQQTDVTNAQSVASLFETVKQRFGHADVLISNAGRLSRNSMDEQKQLRLGDLELDDFLGDLDVNLKGTVLLCHFFARLLGTERRGVVVSTNSVGSIFREITGLCSYAVSKTAAMRLCEYVAVEYSNITAVSMHPGVVATELLPERNRRFAIDTPALAGGFAVWLATDAATFLSGRFVSANWSVDDLVERKEEVLAKNLLKLHLNAELGTQ